MTQECLLALDIGTQSVRSLLIDGDGQLLAKQQVFIEPYFSRAPGYAEQHAHVFWDSLCQASQGVLSQGAVPRDAIKGVALTTQRSTVVNVDRDGNPLRPAIIWLDKRVARNLPPLSPGWRAILKLAGLSSTIARLRADAEVNWLRKNEPEIWRRTHKYLLLSGFLTHRLTGRFVDSVGCQVGYLPFDYRRQQWARPGDLLRHLAPVDQDMLPELIPPGSILGTITPEASAESGIPAGLPLVAAAADKACEGLGSGCLEPERACLSYGTSASISATFHRHRELIRYIPPFPAAVPNVYSLEFQVYRGYWMVNWFKEEFGLAERQRAAEMNCTPESLFDDLIRQVPSGSDGLVLQPYWSPGHIFPGPEARGSVIGFSEKHTRAHFYRAMLEGIAYALREGSELIVARTKVPIVELRIAGGGSQSLPALQMTADIFGLPASRPHIYEATGLGAAIVAAVGVGLHADFPAAVKAMTRVKDTFYPDPHNNQRYNELYHAVYRPLYKRLKPLYKRLLHSRLTV